MLRDGRSPSACPIGYIDTGRGVKVPNPNHAPLIKRAFELYSTGNHDIASITEKMNKLGLRTKQDRPIRIHTMYKILKKKFYYGIITYRGQDWNGTHKEIITKELYDKVQEVMNKKGYKKVRTSAYVFQKFIPCPSCNKPLRSILAKKKYKYYGCKDKQCSFRSTVSETEVEYIFLSELKKIQFTDSECEIFLKAVTKLRSDILSTKEDQIKHLDLEEAKIQKKSELLLNKSLEGQITDDEFRMFKSELVNSRSEIQHRRNALNKADEETLNKIVEIGKLLKQPYIAYLKASDENRRQLVRSMLENIQWKNENLIIHWKKQFEIVSMRRESSIGSPTGNRTPITWMRTTRPNR